MNRRPIVRFYCSWYKLCLCKPDILTAKTDLLWRYISLTVKTAYIIIKLHTNRKAETVIQIKGFPHKQPLYNFMQFHTTPRRNGVKMVYGKSDCRRENDTLLPPPKIERKLWWNTQPSAWPSNGYADGCFIFLLDFLHPKFPVIAWCCD